MNKTGSQHQAARTGLATFFAEETHGNETAFGGTADMYALTAAHKTLPEGTKVRVTNLENGRSVVVVITDRMPDYPRRVIDLAKVAFRILADPDIGKIKVRLEIQDE